MTVFVINLQKVDTILLAFSTSQLTQGTYKKVVKDNTLTFPSIYPLHSMGVCWFGRVAPNSPKITENAYVSHAVLR